MKRLFWCTASVSIGVLISCSPPRVPAQATPLASSGAPTAGGGAAPAKPAQVGALRPSVPAAGASKDVYGYLGKRGILGTITADGPRWGGSFHFVDGGQSFTFEGTATPPEPDVPNEPPQLDGRKVHSYLTCRFTAAPGSATVDDASCLREDDTLEIDGTWSAGKTSEAFYLRTRAADAVDAEEYYAALLTTPTSQHECPPVAEVLSYNERYGRITIWYRLRWPCDRQIEAERARAVLDSPGLRFSQPAAPSAPSYEAYVADITQNAQHQRLWSSQWASLADPDDPNEVTLRFDVHALAPGLELYAARMTDDFQSPTSSGGNYTYKTTVWAVSVNGRYGAKFDLPASEGGHGGWCISSSKSNETWLVDLDGDKVSEIVIKITESGRHDAIGKNGNPECLDSPSTVKFVTYRLNPGTLTWAPAPKSPGLSEQRLARGTQLE